MSLGTVEVAFYASLIFGLTIGTAALIWWARKIFKPLLRATEEQQQKRGVVSLNIVSMQTFVRMLPGLLLFVICCLPFFYFNGLLKQIPYCIEVIRINKIQSVDDDFLQERCGRLDLQELLLQARQPKK
jgi:hypothetical protein